VPFYERQPYIQPLYQIASEVLRGEIRVPRFQRPGTETTWSAERRGDLLDSLYRGFPVGTILLWSTRKPIKTVDAVGGFTIPRASSQEGQRLLLDGHQRLSTLVQILGAGLIHDMQLHGIERAPQDAENASRGEVWVFELRPPNEDTRSRDRFILLKQDQEPSPTQLPLSTALDRKALNRWIREREPPLTDAEVTEADALRDRLREYSIPVAVLVADSLQDATESFKRINSSGVPMSDFNMVAALAYQDDFDPQWLFEQHRSELLEPLGWEDVPDLDVLRLCAVLAGQHPAKMEVDKLAVQLREDRELIARAFRALAWAVQTIGETCGIHGSGALPYSWQLITLAAWHGSDGADTSRPETLPAVAHWFWLTTYGEVFRGVNAAIYDRSLAALRDMTEGRSGKAMERDLTKRVRPVSRFDFRAARSKAVALAMARHQDEGDLNGPAHQALATGVSSMGLLKARGMRSNWWHLAVIPLGEHISTYRDALRHREVGRADPSEDEVLSRIAVPNDARGSIQDLLAARRDRLTAEEQAFVSELGLDWASVY
jgi:hypothetical protein